MSQSVLFHRVHVNFMGSEKYIERCVLYLGSYFFQIQLFWIRAISDPGYRRIFSLIHAEKLSYHVSDQALSSLSRHSQGQQGTGQVAIKSQGSDCYVVMLGGGGWVGV